ncbi:MAG TPA: hypothetical protein VMK65_02170 [Longimicrobiales bacterium]|nr:hypothetical protein [Longimicrobiales bacterium]
MSHRTHPAARRVLAPALVLCALTWLPQPARAQAGPAPVSFTGGVSLGAPASIYDNRITIDRRRISAMGDRDSKALTETRYQEKMDAPVTLFGELWMGVAPGLEAGVRAALGSSATTTTFTGGGAGEEVFERSASWYATELLLRTEFLERGAFSAMAYGGGSVSFWTLETGGTGRDVWLTLADPDLEFVGTTEWSDRSWNTVGGLLGVGVGWRLGDALTARLAVEQRFVSAPGGAFASADREDIRAAGLSIPGITYDAYVSHPTALTLGVSWHLGGRPAPVARPAPTPRRASAAGPAAAAAPLAEVPVLVSGPIPDGAAAVPPFASAGPVPHQAARFRAPDGPGWVLEVHGSAPLEALGLTPADTLVRGLFLYGSEPHPLVSRRESTPAAEGAMGYRLVLPAGRFLYSIEAANADATRVAFSRGQVDTSQRRGGRVQASDLLVGSRATSFGVVPRSYRELVVEPLRCLAVPADGRLVLVVEGYELQPRDGELRYRVEVETGGALEALTVPVEEGLSGLVVRASAGRATWERRIPRAEGRVAELVELELPAGGGPRTVSVRVVDLTDGAGATAARTLHADACGG